MYSLRQDDRIRSFAALFLFLFLETVCVGLFVALDLILFFVFFDLSTVGMYFVIAGWGHRDAARAALNSSSTRSPVRWRCPPACRRPRFTGKLTVFTATLDGGYG